ncbi:MAG: hypothetical protein IJS61_10075 [Firmicutes bacterium]|nr:hypothetical protein [Bacillota bacterium]
MKIKKILTTLFSIGVLVGSLAANVYSADIYKDINVNVTYGSDISALTKGDEYKVYDTFISLTDTSVNRMTSEHFQIIWGNSNTSNINVNYDFIKGNLINLENIRLFYINELNMKDIGISRNKNITEKRKTNIYVSNTGLKDFNDDWAYMSVDGDSFAFLFLNPDAMRVDMPSWVVPHELAHAFTYHQGGEVPGAWYESTANWFRDMYLGSEYYAYGNNVYGPASDFFGPYIVYSDYYVPHVYQWYDTWPLFTYITENPDNINGLGLGLMNKLFEYSQIRNKSMYDIIETLSGVDKKTLLGYFARRMATFDFERKEMYKQGFEEYKTGLRYSSAPEDKVRLARLTLNLNQADGQGYITLPEDRYPMQTGFNIIPLEISGNNITVDFVNTSTYTEADFRTSIVTESRSNVARYSDILQGSGRVSIDLTGDEKAAYLVVCATPDNIKNFDVDWSSSTEDTAERYTYKFKQTENTDNLNTLTAGYYSAQTILSDTRFTVTKNEISSTTELRLATGAVKFAVEDDAYIYIDYGCSSTNTSRSAALSLNGEISEYVAGRGAAKCFEVGPLSKGSYEITALQNGGTSAKIYGITVKYPLKGDFDTDGDVDRQDVASILKHITKSQVQTSPLALVNGDTDERKGIDIGDAIYILRNL